MFLFQTNYDSPIMTIAMFSFFSVIIYFLPTIAAMARNHHRKWKIILLNIFAGWTIIGWICALVWAFTLVKLPHQLKREKRLSNLGKLS